MKRAILIALLGALLIAVPISAGIAQEETPAEPVTVDLGLDDVDASNYPEVTITVTVPFELAGDTFSLADFFVSENGQSRELNVQQVPGDRLAVVLAIDTSGSMRGAPLAEAKNAVTSFVDQMPPGVAFALVRFGTSSDLVVPFTIVPDEIKTAVAGLTAGGETALYDAIIESGTIFEGLEGVRRSLILLSDGGDTASVASLEQGIVALLTAEAEFVAVELLSPENDSAALQRLQISTQGQIVSASNPDAFEGIFGALASDLLNQFRILFTAQAGGATELTVAVRGENVAAVSTSSVRFPALSGAEPPATATVPPTTIASVTTLVPGVAAPTPASASNLALPWYQTSGGLTIAGFALFVGLFGILALARPAQATAGVAALRGLAVSGRRSDRRILSGLADRATMFAEEALQRSGRAGGLRLLLDQAGLNLRVGEFALLMLIIVLVAVVVGNAFFGLVGAVVGAVFAVLAPIAAVSTLGSQRAKRFQGQLADTLQLIAGALRAGFGINQAIDGVVAEASEPSSSEYKRVSLEVQLGRELEDALQLMADRVQSEDLRMAAEAVEIHRQVGGDLAELLERVSMTIRERENIRRQIEVLSAEGKLSAVVLIGLPIFIAITVRGVAPDYLSVLTDTGVGQILILIGVVLMLIGIMWIRRIIQLKF